MPFIKSIVTGQTCESTRPFPDPVIFAEEEMNVPPENCLMIGDTTVDIMPPILTILTLAKFLSKKLN